ncbi:MAG: alpha/beta hydrolase [Steroidobacter sp.]
MLSEDRFIALEGASLRVRSVGKGPAIVMVHGWALDLDLWRPQMDLLADRYRVIAYDRRGFGRSTGVPGIEQDVHDLERLLDWFDIPSAALVGMSQGARVALRLALKHQRRTSCLVLDGPPAEGWSETIGAQEIPLDAYRAQVRSEGIDAFHRMWLQHPFMQLHTTAPCAQLLLKEIAIRYPARDLLMDEPPQVSLLAERDLQQLNVPMLVLSGEFDSPQRRAIASRLTRLLPDAQLRTIPAAGHLAALDDPRTYAQALRDFFSSQPAMDAGRIM